MRTLCVGFLRAMVRYIVNCEVDNLLHGGFGPTKENVDENPGTSVLRARPIFCFGEFGKREIGQIYSTSIFFILHFSFVRVVAPIGDCPPVNLVSLMVDFS